MEQLLWATVLTHFISFLRIVDKYLKKKKKEKTKQIEVYTCLRIYLQIIFTNTGMYTKCVGKIIFMF